MEMVGPLVVVDDDDDMLMLLKMTRRNQIPLADTAVAVVD